MKLETNILQKKFNALHGSKVSRKELETLLDLAKEDNNTPLVYRISKILNTQPDATHFEIEIINYPSSKGLTGAMHKGAYKEALDDCGRLRPGFKFENGTVVKVVKKPKPQPTPVDKKTTEIKNRILRLKKKYALSGYDKFPTITVGLNGTKLADGHSILTDDEIDIYGDYVNGLNANAKDVEQIVNELILEKIKTGAELPAWKQSWATKTNILAQNFETKKEYTGSNAIILNVLLGSIMPTPYYLTAAQIEKMKGQIKKGAKSVPLVYYNFIYTLKDLSSNPSSEAELLKKINGYEVKRKGKKSIFLNQSNYAGVNLTEKEISYLELERNEYLSYGFLRYYRVFNIADTTGIPYEIPTPKPTTEKERIAKAEKVIAGYKDIPKLTKGKDATYNIKTDVIAIPDISEFEPVEEYYTTLFHEMIHSTMNENRLNRIEKYKGKDQNAQYAFEELIAELGASYLAGICGILNVVHLNSASYLKGWHEKLQKMTETYSDFFVFATKEAQKAVDYILQGYNENESTETEDNDEEKEILLLKAKALKLKLKLKAKI